MLSGKGFKEVYNLKGGIKAWEGLKVAGPPEMGMEALSGTESLSKLVIIAYGMEKGLSIFYREIAKSTDNESMVQVLTNLAKVERIHMDRLFQLYETIEPEKKDRDLFEAQVNSNITEGGFNLDQLLNEKTSILKTKTDIISLAMMIEAHGLDLYMRYSQSVEHEQGKKVFFDLAQEEKSHLTWLGDLMDDITGTD